MKNTLLPIALCLFCHSAIAAEETSAYASPKCDAAKIKEMVVTASLK